jgi:hypothetical protein
MASEHKSNEPCNSLAVPPQCLDLDGTVRYIRNTIIAAGKEGWCVSTSSRFDSVKHLPISILSPRLKMIS